MATKTIHFTVEHPGDHAASARQYAGHRAAEVRKIDGEVQDFYVVALTNVSGSHTDYTVRVTYDDPAPVTEREAEDKTARGDNG